MNDSQRKIAAAAALSKIAEIRQYNLKENYAHLLEDEFVSIINDEAKKATGIDLLNNKNKIGFNEIDKYEDFLDKIVYDNLKIKHHDSFLSEQIALLEDTEDYSIDSFRNLSIDNNTLSFAVKGIFKAIGMTAPSIIPILKSPIKVQRLKGFRDEFLSVSKFSHKSKTLYVLFHNGVGAYAERALFKTINELAEDSADVNLSRDDSNINAVTCFLFSEETAHNESPIGLFFKAIIKYGQSTTVGNITKKFFHKGYSSKLLLDNHDSITLIQDTFGVKGHVVGHVNMNVMNARSEYQNLYFLYADRMAQDYKSRNFQ